MLGWILKFILVLCLAFIPTVLCLKVGTFGASVLRVFALSISPEASRACSVFTTIFGVELATLGLFLVGVPIFSLLSRSLRYLFRNNLRRVVSWGARLIMATLIGYGFSLSLGAMQVSSVASLIAGFIAFPVALSSGVRGRLLAFIEYLIPPQVIPEFSTVLKLGKILKRGKAVGKAQLTVKQLESVIVKLGYIWNPIENREGRETGLSEWDLLSGIGVFGEESVYTSKLIVASASSTGYSYVILDFWDRYRNLLNHVKDARVFRLGTNLTINPFSTEGMDHSDYVELFLTALSQAYRLSNEEIRLAHEFLLDAYEQAAGQVLTVRRAEAFLDGFMEEMKEDRERQRAVQAVNRAFWPLFRGKTCEAVTGAQTMSVERLFTGLTVIELGSYYGYEFRTFIQALILLKYYAWLSSRKRTVTKTIVLLDAIESLFPNRLNLPYHCREPRLVYRLNELKQLGVGIHVCTEFASEVDRGIFDLLGTKIVHRLNSERDHFLFEELLYPNRGQAINLRMLHPRQALIERASTRDARLIVVDRPSWLFSEAPAPAQAELRPEEAEYLTEEVQEQIEARSQKTRLEQDFGEDAPKAYHLLKTLTEYSEVTRTALVETLSGVSKEEAEDLLSRLEERFYVRIVVRKEKSIRRPILQLTLKALKALKEFEATQKTLDPSGAKGGEKNE